MTASSRSFPTDHHCRYTITGRRHTLHTVSSCLCNHRSPFHLPNSPFVVAELPSSLQRVPVLSARRLKKLVLLHDFRPPRPGARKQEITMADHRNTSFSAIVAQEVNGSHVLKIDGYSRTRELTENGKYLQSVQFCVGGHSWLVRYYPNGCVKEVADYISVVLVVDSAVAKDVKAKFRFHLLDKNGIPVPSYSLNSTLHTFSSKETNWGYHEFMKKEALESSVHLKDDCFTIRCDVIVMKEIRSERATDVQFVVVPPSNLHQHFGDLLKNMDGTDVTFEVNGEIFSAHRCVLAARSTVFKAELFGSMEAKTRRMPIKICDMENEVFKSLIHFIYMDSLPEITEEVSNEVDTLVAMTQHLLVAADRYNIERLKLLCEEKLCKHMDSNMVATTLALAEQHSCSGLKKACFHFLASSSNMKAMAASDGYEHLQSSCPSVLKELISMFQPLDS